jgi:hypothetical protein
MTGSEKRTDEKLADKVKRLTREMEKVQSEISRCPHTFTEPMTASRKYMEPIFARYEGIGSDPEPVYDWVPRTESGWRRECTKCGYEQYTAKTRPAAFAPDFC